MQFDYFYGSQAEQFSFYRIPKVLFTDPQFKPLSTDAKVLYGILLDRMSLSVKNHWLDEQSRVYIIFTTEEIMEALSCANQKACRLILELEKDAGLIERKRQGLGKPSLIYVKNFAVSSHFWRCDYHTQIRLIVIIIENYADGSRLVKDVQTIDDSYRIGQAVERQVTAGDEVFEDALLLICVDAIALRSELYHILHLAGDEDCYTDYHMRGKHREHIASSVGYGHS